LAKNIPAGGSGISLEGNRLRPYEKNPQAIYAASFATVRAEARLARFAPAMQPLVTRLIHACGMVEIADRLAFSPDAVAAGQAALAAGAPVLCDCEMVAAGVIRRRLPAANPVIVTLNDPAVPDIAARVGNTRSAAAVELWRDHLAGAVVAIGNAPTALFHLLELLDAGWPKPAVILGFPVGFVGAAESKAELAADPRGVPFVALKGRRGGSAMASAAVNALAAGLNTEFTKNLALDV
jgi:precorrin-8X/cobalt-precorrin-8 methylmutase